MIAQVNEIAVSQSQFQKEKKIVKCSVILFTIAYLVRMIITLLIVFDVIRILKMGEFNVV